MCSASGRSRTILITGIHRGLHSGIAAAEFLDRHAARSHSVAAGYFVAESSDQIMAVRLITTWDDLAALEQPWNALSDGMPMRSWDWLATWWKHYGAARCLPNQDAPRRGDRALHVLAVYGDTTCSSNGHGCKQELLGIAPWYLDRTVVKGNVLRWLGSGEVCTDHRTLICRPQHHAEVAGTVADALTTQCDEWDQLDLSAIDADDAAIGSLTAELEERGCIISRHAADACWSLELTGELGRLPGGDFQIAPQAIATPGA